MYRVLQSESHRLKLHEASPLDTPGTVQEDSTDIRKVDINSYIERVHRKVPFGLREAYMTNPRRRSSYSKSHEERRRNSTDGCMHFDVDPAESIHWNFPVPLTDGTGDMTLRNMSINVDAGHEIMQLQFEADIRVQVNETPRLRKDSRSVDGRIETDMQTESRVMVCAEVQTDSVMMIPPLFAACFSGRVLSHHSSILDRAELVPEPVKGGSICCTLQ